MNETKKNAFANELTDEELDHVSGGVGEFTERFFEWIKCPRCGHVNLVPGNGDLNPRCEVPSCKKKLR
ncbi:MAG: bacteriocin [Oscillibacter sp.]|nr:bacteriocin [Oscillibacter sp.]